MELWTLTDALRRGLEVLADGEPHDTTKGQTGPHGRVNGNVMARLVDMGLAIYDRCGCCGHSAGVVINDVGRAHL